jgi:tetratricopeptide (TPR) repeat protein
MAEVLLTPAVSQAEEAIESGNYGGAIETCQRILGQFPEFAGAHRIMGDAYAEQGQVDAAREAYQRTLERDPQSIPAYLGLGMLAEDAGEPETALAYFQVAWEIDPRRRDLREHVSRISQLVYGADGRLYLTRAALTSLHFHAGRWDRAVSEAAQVLNELPSRIDVQVRLTESLWRRGDDQQSRQVCTSILRALPQAVVPLLILADIHRREGDGAGADEFLQHARSIDPAGVRAADLIIVGLDDQAEFLAVDSVPTIDDQLVIEEPAHYAPAPDFTVFDEVDARQEDIGVSEQPAGEPDLSDLDPTGVQPFRWDDIGDEDLELSDLDGFSPPPEVPTADFADPDEFTLPSDEELEKARPGPGSPHGYTNMLNSLDSEGVEPFDFSFGDESPEQSAETPDSATEPEFDWDSFSMPTEEELNQARPKTDQLAGHTNMLDSLDSSGVEPFDPFDEREPAQPEQPIQEQSFEEVPPSMESSGDAAAEPVQPSGPDQEDLAEIDDWLSEFTLPSEHEIDEARPGEERPAGFTGVLDSLEAEGMEPFDPLAGADGEAASAEGSAGTPTESTEGVTQESGEETESPFDLDELGESDPFSIDWSSIDEEIEDATPGEMPPGYTGELRSLDEGGLEPFSFEDQPVEEADLPEEVFGEREPEPEEPVHGGDADDLFDEWDEVARETDELTMPPKPSGETELESVEVFFDDDWTEDFAPTEPLRAFDEESPVDSSVGSVWDEPSEGTDSVEGVSEDAGTSEVAEGLVEFESALLGGDAPDRFGESASTELGDVSRESFSGVNGIAAERLGLDEDLIERARKAKHALIASGRIAGRTSLTGDHIEVDVDSLTEQVAADPTDVDARVKLAAVLLDRDPDGALEQYRWLYRHTPERASDIVDDIVRLIDVMREREVGVHRLLGAIYRRHGDWAAASRHYEESLLGRSRRNDR